MTTQPPTTEERLSRLEGSHERIGDLVQQVEGLRSETRGQIEGLRSEMHGQIEGLRSEMNVQIEGLRSEMNAQIGAFRAEMNAHIRTLYMMMGGSWVTLMATIIGLNLAG